MDLGQQRMAMDLENRDHSTDYNNPQEHRKR